MNAKFRHGMILALGILAAGEAIAQQDRRDEGRARSLRAADEYVAMPEDPVFQERMKAVSGLLFGKSNESWPEVVGRLQQAAPGELGTGTRQEREQRAAAIRAEADAKPYLFALLDLHYRTLQSEKVPDILKAISLRDDLDETDVARISDELGRILERPYLADDYLNNSYLAAGVRVLTRDPDSESESVAIRILKRSKEADWIYLPVAASESLAVIGGNRSLPSLRATSQWADTQAAGHPGLDWAAERIRQSQVRLEKRLGSRTLDRPRPDAKTRSNHHLPPTSEYSKFPRDSGEGPLPAAAAFLLLIFAGLLYLKNGKPGRMT